MSGEIERLDRALARKGEWITLRRTVGTVNKAVTDVDCRARVTGYAPVELVAGITQQSSLVIISPTQINNAGWPGGQPVGSDNDPRVPSANKGDVCIIAGKPRSIEAAIGVYINGILVRIEMQVRG